MERKVFEQASNESDEKNKEDEMDKKKETDTNTVEILPNYSPFKHKKDVL